MKSNKNFNKSKFNKIKIMNKLMNKHFKILKILWIKKMKYKNKFKVFKKLIIK